MTNDAVRMMELLHKVFDNMVDYWHENKTDDITLREFLGLTIEEYKDLV